MILSVMYIHAAHNLSGLIRYKRVLEEFLTFSPWLFLRPFLRNMLGGRKVSIKPQCLGNTLSTKNGLVDL